jgi:stearoyl-CoA 9-desaturase NADPH oxidoreductase
MRSTTALPAGDFVLPERLPGRLLFITAGSGITPVMSMLRSLDARGTVPYLTIIHAAPDAASMIYGDELAVLAARHPRITLHRIHTRTQGRFDASQLDALCRGWELCETWACGPDALLQQLEDHWQRAGVGERLHVERFRPRALQAADAAAGRVQFLRSGRIELAELHGMAPAHGCRMGICHGCTATLKSGCVRDLRNGKTYSDEGDLVQICVCAPVGDVEIDL